MGGGRGKYGGKKKSNSRIKVVDFTESGTMGESRSTSGRAGGRRARELRGTAREMVSINQRERKIRADERGAVYAIIGVHWIF